MKTDHTLFSLGESYILVDFGDTSKAAKLFEHLKNYGK
jgi:hypothetical protein